MDLLFKLRNKWFFQSAVYRLPALYDSTQTGSPTKKAYTLIEMLVVMAIIVLLAGIILPAAIRARRQLGITSARTTIATLQAALGRYVVAWGDYPPSGSSSMIEALLSVDPDRGGPFITIKPRDLVGPVGNRQMKDPWHGAGFPGSVYQYVYADGSPFLFGVTSTLKQVYIYSLGYDMATQHPFGGGDDITSWR